MIFCLVALFILFVVCLVIIPKWRASKWLPADSIKNFYETPKDTLDVIFYGSSAMGCAVSPYLLYEEQGISSYNLALQSQNLFSTYMWLKESLNYQQPKLVVLDVKELSQKTETREEMVRRSYEYMRTGTPKLEFATEHCKDNQEADFIDYLFPIQIYHSRWNELKKDDFAYVAGENISYARGFNLLDSLYDVMYTGLSGGGDPSGEGFLEVERYNLERYIALCKEKGIEVLLIKSVDSKWTENLHAYAERLAAENAVPFLDFNMSDLMQEIGFNSQTDMQDPVHMNLAGGEKLTRYLGKYIKEHYELPDCRTGDSEAQKVFEEGMDQYKAAITDGYLSLETDFTSWLTMLSENKDLYNVIVSCPNVDLTIGEKEAKLLNKIGFPKELSEGLLKEEKLICAAMAGEESLYAELNPEKSAAKLHQMFEDGTVADVSAKEEKAAISLDNKKQESSKGAIIITVYNRVTGQVADSVKLAQKDDGTVELKRQKEEEES